MHVCIQTYISLLMACVNVARSLSLYFIYFLFFATTITISFFFHLVFLGL